MNKLSKITLLLLLALSVANSSFSQSLVWEKATGLSNSVDYCYSSAPLGKSRYLFGGYTWRQSTNLRIPLLVFTNTGGDTLFTRRYPQLNDGDILAVSTTQDSSIVAAGNFTNVTINQGRLFVFKADYNGVILWQKEFNPGIPGNMMKLQVVPGGNLIYTEGSAALLKLDMQGNQLWQKTIPLGNATGGGISPMKDGSYLACGSTTDKSPTTLSNFYKPNPFLVKLKPNGDTIRTKIFGSFTDQDLLYEAKETADGGIIMVGRYVLNTNPTLMQGLVMKFDSAWNQQWWYTIMPQRGDYDAGCELFNVQQLADSSYIVSGSNADAIPNSLYGDGNGYVARIAKDGSAILWEGKYTTNMIRDFFNDMFYMSDGSAVFSGSRVFSNSAADFFMVKLKNLGLPYVPDYCQQKPSPQLSVQVIANDTITFTSTSTPGTRYGTISTYLWRFGDGNISTLASPKHKYNMPLAQLQNMPVTLIVTNNSGCTDSITVYPFLRVSAPEAMPGLQVQLYPNPASAKATFSISGYSGKEAVTVELLDVLGRKLNVPVKQVVNDKTQQLEVNTAALPAGLYLYRLYSGSRLLGTGKLVKE